MPTKPIIEPTERSNSPPIIKSAAPVPMIINCAVTVSQLSTPSEANIPVPPAVTPKKAKTRTTPAKAPRSGRARNRRHAECRLRRSSMMSTTGVSFAAPSGRIAISRFLADRAAGEAQASRRRSLAVFPGELLDHGDVVLGDEAGAGIDVVGRDDAI